jgi:dCMP deaminase
MQNRNLLLLKRADKIAKKSKDQSTKVGAFLMDEEEISPLGFGYNGMPRGLPDDDPEKNQRPEKYLWFEHAERNAIYNSAQPLMQNSMILLTHFPNMEATRAIVSSGIDKIIVPEHDQNSEHYARVLEMLKYSKVELVSLDDSNLDPKLKRKYKEDMEFTQEYAEDLASPFSPRPEGALILNQKTFAPIGMGESGPPPSLNIDAEQIKEKGANFWIQEAAKNAIFNTVRPKLKNSHAFVSWCPCAQCALALASVGTKKVITYQPDFTNEADLRWKEHFEQTAKLFNTLNIDLDLVTKDAMKNLLIEQQKKPKPRMR